MATICASCGQATETIICPRCDVGATEPATVRAERADARAGTAAVVIAVLFGVGWPLFALVIGVYGIYRLSRLPADYAGARVWRRLGIIAVVLLALWWGMFRRIMMGG